MNEKTWLEDPKLLPSVAKTVESEHASRMAENKSYLRFYWDRPVMGSVNYTRPYRELAVFEHVREQYGNNLTAEVIDAAAAYICREMQAEVLPKGAEFELEQGCKQASRLIEGVFDNSDFLTIATRAFRDGCTADIGPVKGYIDHEAQEIRFERLNPLETYWVNDGSDNPRTFITVTAISRDALIARYPAKKSQLKDVATWAQVPVVGVDLPGSAAKASDTVKLTEAWCRALGEDSPGRHSIVCGDLVLEDEAWSHEVTPIVAYKWMDDFRGFGGKQLARTIAKYDSANRRLMRMVYAGLQGAVPWLLTHEDSEVDGVSDVEFQKVVWAGTTPPQVVMPQTVSPEIIAQLDRNKQAAYAEGGVNQNMATGSAPARYTSGAAQREFVDIANTRLLQAQKQWEKFWKEAARVVVILAQQAKKTHVRVKGANHYESVSFPKLPRDKYRVNFGLVSGLGLTPSARLEDLKDLQDMGLADVADVARNLNLPDTRQLADRLNAPRDLVMRQISQALDAGKMDMPSSLQGDQLNNLVKIAGEEYQRARMQGNYPPKHLEALRRLILAAKARLAPPPPPPANDNGQPLAPPAPAPQPMPPQPAPQAMPPAAAMA